MIIQFLSHSTCLLKIDKFYLLIDPFLSSNPILKHHDYHKYFNHIDVIHYILVSHAHFDHVCDVEFFAKKYHSTIISNYEISIFFEKKGLITYGINYGSFINFPFGKLKYIWATHSSMFNDGTYGGNPGGFLLSTLDKKNIYFAGDTALHYDMMLIPQFVTLDISILPIGGKYTMDYEEAIIASKLLKSNKILGVHYNTFSDIQIDNNIVTNQFAKKGKQLILLKTGEKILI
ncbi:metal-dependent hydrolase [Blattabacterium cuenoti]|uniref:metal-dependent hydrolase n=1 Tax=Blattabacterium cuenoti TaxID=1653831 RepID=UPI00163B829D|nr:metal-dependent hydrolase [Blattabacterium cuenoti]